MSVLYVYAVLRARPRGALPRGLAGEPLRLVGGGGLLAAVGALPHAPAPTAAALRAHDRTVRRLAARADAVLPARFGTLVAGPAALRARLEPRADALRRALAFVAGREQMTLRVYGARRADGLAPTGRASGAPAAGAGTRYLEARRRARAVVEIAPLRPALAGIVIAERVERHDRPPLLASLYHLVRRGDGARYRRAITRARRALAGVRVRASGPWPPYAFADEALP